MVDAAPLLQTAGHSMSDDPDWIPPAHWVRAIQRAQHRAPCYRTDERFQCVVQDCEWRQSCCKLVAAWRR
jgi:hypothetical protein